MGFVGKWVEPFVLPEVQSATHALLLTFAIILRLFKIELLGKEF